MGKLVKDEKGKENKKENRILRKSHTKRRRRRRTRRKSAEDFIQVDLIRERVSLLLSPPSPPLPAPSLPIGAARKLERV